MGGEQGKAGGTTVGGVGAWEGAALVEVEMRPTLRRRGEEGRRRGGE